MGSNSISRQINPQNPLRRRDDLRIPYGTCNSPDDFVQAVRPFHRIVYLIAFACTKDRNSAEIIAVEAMAAAFKLGRGHGQVTEELKLSLIRTALCKAQRYVDRNARPDIEKVREDIGDLVMSQALKEWRPIPRSAVREDAVRSSLMRAIQELSANTAVTLLLRDAFHFTPLPIAGLIGVSQQKVRARLAYGRIALCTKLANRESNRDIAGEPSFAVAY